jgi:hypothetical protein
MYTLLEKAYTDQIKGKIPHFPLWLSPTHVRLIPISDEYTAKCADLADKLRINQIRADVDDPIPAAEILPGPWAGFEKLARKRDKPEGFFVQIEIIQPLCGCACSELTSTLEPWSRSIVKFFQSCRS